MGLAGEHIKNMFGRLSGSEMLSGIPGSETDHFGVPYTLTEEFVAVYRMHPLIPDDITFWSAQDGRQLQQIGLQAIAGDERAGHLRCDHDDGSVLFVRADASGSGDVA